MVEMKCKIISSMYTFQIFVYNGHGFLLAALFFTLSAFFELACVLLYAFVFPKLPIVKYYRSKAASEGSKTVSADLAAAGIQNQNQEVGVFLMAVWFVSFH